MKIYKPGDDRLVVPISNSVVGFNREVEFVHLEYFTGANGENTYEVEKLAKFLKVKFLIRYFKYHEEEVNTVDEHGDPVVELKTTRVNVLGLPPSVTEDEFVANHHTYVDMSNGMIISRKGEVLTDKVSELVSAGVYTQEFVDSEDFEVGTQIDFFEKAFNSVNPSLPPEMQGLIPVKPMIYSWAQQAVFKDIPVDIIPQHV